MGILAGGIQGYICRMQECDGVYEVLQEATVCRIYWRYRT